MNAEKKENRQNRWADFKGRRNKTPWDLEWVQVSRLGICLGPTSGIDIRANKNPGHDNLNRKPLEGLDSLSRNYSQITLTIQFELVDTNRVITNIQGLFPSYSSSTHACSLLEKFRVNKHSKRTDCWDSGNDFPELQFIQNSGLSSSIQPNCKRKIGNIQNWHGP